MIVELWAIGKTKDRWLQTGIEEYTKRIPRLSPFAYQELAGPKLSKSATADQVKTAEAEYIEARLQKGDRLFLFDERGKAFTSRAFATWLEAVQHNGGSRILLLIGGAYGFGESLKARAEGSLRLSNMTLTHQMARLLAAEQLYRGYSILRGLPYHND